MARTEEELEREVVEAVRLHRCVHDPEVLEFMSKLKLAGGGLPVSCATCGHLFRKGEEMHGLWVTTPYDSWGVGVCARCHERLGDRADASALEGGVR